MKQFTKKTLSKTIYKEIKDSYNEFNVAVDGEFFPIDETIESFDCLRVKEIFEKRCNEIIDDFQIVNVGFGFRNGITINIKSLTTQKVFGFKFFRTFKFQVPGFKNSEDSHQLTATIIKYINTFSEKTGFTLSDEYSLKIIMVNSRTETNCKLNLEDFRRFLINSGKITLDRCHARQTYARGLILYFPYKYSEDMQTLYNSRTSIHTITIILHKRGTMIMYGVYDQKKLRNIIKFISDAISEYITSQTISYD